MANLADATDASSLPGWLQILFSLGTIVAGAVVVRMGYRRADGPEETKTDVTSQVVGGALADRASMVALAEAIDRHAAVLERGVSLAEKRYAAEQKQAEVDNIRDDLIDDFRRQGRLKEPF